MEKITFVDTTTGKEYEKIIGTKVAADPKRRANKIEVLKKGVATTAITNEWRKVHEYRHNGTVSDVWKDPSDIDKWEKEVNERAKYIVVKKQ